MEQPTIPIRTPTGRLYGTLNLESYTLKIKDGSTVRSVQIPADGTKLEYSARDQQPEVIHIPPKESYSAQYS